MRGYWDICLTVGRNVNLGQLYNMRTDDLKSDEISYQIETNNINDPFQSDKCLIIRDQTDNQLPRLLGISKQQLLRKICYPTSEINNFLEFLLPPVPKYILLRYEKITQTQSLKNIGQFTTFTHMISKIYYGSIVFIRIVPFDEDINIDELYQTLQNGNKHNAMLEQCCKIESFTNWEIKGTHSNINEAINYAEMQMEKKHYFKIRYTLSRVTQKPIWQEIDDVIIALQNILRLRTAQNALNDMLQRFGVNDGLNSFSPFYSLDEKMVNNLKSYPFFQFKKLKQAEYITSTLGIFMGISGLQVTCFEYMRKRYASFEKPIIPNIFLDSTDMNMISLCREIFEVFDENYIEERKGKFYFNVKTKSQELSMIKSVPTFLLINGEENLQFIDTFYQRPKINGDYFLPLFLITTPKTLFVQEELSQLKNEQIILHKDSKFQYLGLANVTDFNSQLTSPSASNQLFYFSCRCRNIERRAWICCICNEFMTTENSGKPYCKCGKHEISNISLKCYNIWHGKEFVEEKTGNLIKSLFTTVFGCSSSMNQRQENVEMGQELYESNEMQQYSIAKIPHVTPKIIDMKISVVEKPKDKAEIYKYSTNIQPKEFFQTNQQQEVSEYSGSPLPNDLIQPSFQENSQQRKLPQPKVSSHSYNLRRTTQKIEESDNIKVKQRSLIIKDTKKLLVDTPHVRACNIQVLNKDQTVTSQHDHKIVTKQENKSIQIKKANMVEKEKVIKKINIAIIGESGVGKSTLLNAISNYLKFETSQDALYSKNLEYIIPCQFKVFMMTDDDLSEKLVSIGMPDENEQYSDVLSTTQECKEHSFEFEGYKINFIDTPGLNDTDGIEKDEKNLEKIRSYICSLDSLHAICFVVKANESRMDIGFSKSMSDLLSIFPKSALSKVIFFMTHSRSTLFGPGDTMNRLSQISENLLKTKNATFPLSSNNIFCVDNEAFLFLCAKNQGIEYSGASIDDFEISWKKSKQATQRFFNKITTIKLLITVEIQLIRDLKNVLQEQKEILNHKHSDSLLTFHYLTAKALELLESGNSAGPYIKEIDMNIVKEEAEHCNIEINHITPSTLLSFVNFSLECENGETPVADSFIDKYFSE